MIHLLILAAATSVPLHGFEQAVVDCVTQQAVALGGSNSEPADAVIEAAQGQCAGAWNQAAMIAPWTITPPTPRELLRSIAYAEAFKALEAARLTHKAP